MPKKIKELFKSQHWLTKEYKASQKKLSKFLKDRGSQTKLEKQMEKDLREIMLADFETNNPERKFRFEHIESLLKMHKVNPRPNIVFVYGKKNIGKTWALARKLREMHDRDKDAQFIFIRNKQQDETAIEQMFNEEIWPVKLIGGKLYWKQQDKKGRPKKQERLAG